MISVWAPSHGFEAIFNWKNLLLGFTVLFLARTQGALYLLNNNSNPDSFFKANRSRVMVNGAIFVVLFLIFAGVLLTSTGLETTFNGGIDGLRSTFAPREFKYFHNLVEMPWTLAIFLIGVVMVLYAIIRSTLADHWTDGIWWSGTGTILVVL